MGDKKLCSIRDRVEKMTNNIEAYAITKDEKIVGKIIGGYHSEKSGNYSAGVWDWTGEALFQGDRCGGHGFDHLGACLDGLRFGGVELSHNWKMDLSRAGFDHFQIV